MKINYFLTENDPAIYSMFCNQTSSSDYSFHWEGCLDAANLMILPGNAADIDPRWFGDLAHPKTKSMDSWYMVRMYECVGKALKRHIPVVGICGGFQFLMCAMGNRITQHMGYISGKQNIESADLYKKWPDDDIRCFTGSVDHHQGFLIPGGSVRGTITHYSDTGHNVLCSYGFIDPVRKWVGVQWHPEWDEPGSDSQNEFFNLVERIMK